jgi:hypothetical protein
MVTGIGRSALWRGVCRSSGYSHAGLQEPIAARVHARWLALVPALRGRLAQGMLSN